MWRTFVVTVDPKERNFNIEYKKFVLFSFNNSQIFSQTFYCDYTEGKKY